MNKVSIKQAQEMIECAYEDTVPEEYKETTLIKWQLKGWAEETPKNKLEEVRRYISHLKDPSRKGIVGLPTVLTVAEQYEMAIEELKDNFIKQGYVKIDKEKLKAAKDYVVSLLHSDGIEYRAYPDIAIQHLSKLYEQAISNDPADYVEPRPLPERRFIEYDHYILDTKTNLKWQKECNSNKYTFDQALKYAQNLKWRLPTIEELLSIVDYTKYNPATQLPNIVADNYWSSSSYVNFTSVAWYVDFNNGNASSIVKTNSYYTCCIVDDRV